jgi:feruloyl esterase
LLSDYRPPLQVNETELERITAIADATDPGHYNTVNPNLRPFFKRGGKVLQYHGLGDAAIPWANPICDLTFFSFLIFPARRSPGSSIDYYEKARAYLRGSDISNSYRLFLVPGMNHCLGGTGADSFGRPSQQDDSVSGNGQSLVSDPDHDAVLALMRWVEKGKAPKSIIGASYVGGDRKQGVAFTRLLCPYPQVRHYVVIIKDEKLNNFCLQEGKYVGGNVNNSTSYRCE